MVTQNDGYGDQALDHNQLANRWQNSVISGCAVSPGTNDLTVQVASGEAIVAGTRVNVAAQDNVSLSAADPNNPRKDTVYVNGAGTLQVETGTAEPAAPSGNLREDTYRPAPPDMTGVTGCVIAEVWVPEGASDIASADVRDRRLFADAEFGSVTTAKVTNDNYVEAQATASAGASYTIDLSTANYHKVTMTGDTTFDFSNVDGADVNSVLLHLVQDGTGGRSPSFTPTVVWDGGTVPSWSTAANAEDVVTLVHDQDGSQWLGFLGGLGMA